MATPTFVINPDGAKVTAALASWQWMPIEGKRVVVVTSFGDFFLQDTEGIWFLDRLAPH